MFIREKTKLGCLFAPILEEGRGEEEGEKERKRGKLKYFFLPRSASSDRCPAQNLVEEKKEERGRESTSDPTQISSSLLTLSSERTKHPSLQEEALFLGSSFGYSQTN